MCWNRLQEIQVSNYHNPIYTDTNMYTHIQGEIQGIETVVFLAISPRWIQKYYSIMASWVILRRLWIIILIVNTFILMKKDLI